MYRVVSLVIFCFGSLYAQECAYVIERYAPAVAVIDLSTQQVIATITVPGNPYDLVASLDGKYIYVAHALEQGIVSVIDSSTNQLVQQITVGNKPHGFALTNDGKYLYTANSDSNSVSVVDLITYEVVATVAFSDGLGTLPFEIVMSPDGLHAYVANLGSSTVSVIRLSDNIIVDTLSVGISPNDLAVTPDGSYLLVADTGSQTVLLFNLATYTSASVTVGGEPQVIAITADSLTAYVQNYEQPGAVNVINIAAATTSSISVGSHPSWLAMTPSGDRIYVTNTQDNTVSVITTYNNQVEKTINVGQLPVNVAVAPDGSTVIVSNQGDNTLSVIRTSDDTVVGAPVLVNSPTVIIFVNRTSVVADFGIAVKQENLVLQAAYVVEVNVKTLSAGPLGSQFRVYTDSGMTRRVGEFSLNSSFYDRFKERGQTYTYYITVVNADGSETPMGSATASVA